MGHLLLSDPLDRILFLHHQDMTVEVPVVTVPEPAQPSPKLKPGPESSEFQGKMIVQAVMGILAIVNAILQQFGREPILIEAETAALVVASLEALWMSYRQINKGLEVRAQRDVEIARATKEPKA